MNKEILLLNIDKVHTTKMGIDRIKQILEKKIERKRDVKDLNDKQNTKK